MIDIMKLVKTLEESVVFFFFNKSEKLKIKQKNKKVDFWVCY